jgi:hypothetical protein
MAESAALLVDEVFPHAPIRQWVLSFPFQLRLLFARDPAIMGQVLGLVYRALSTYLINKAGFTRRDAQTGAVTLIQRFGSALNLNIHLGHTILIGTACCVATESCPTGAPTAEGRLAQQSLSLCIFSTQDALYPSATAGWCSALPTGKAGKSDPE